MPFDHRFLPGKADDASSIEHGITMVTKALAEPWLFVGMLLRPAGRVCVASQGSLGSFGRFLFGSAATIGNDNNSKNHLKNYRLQIHPNSKSGHVFS